MQRFKVIRNTLPNGDQYHNFAVGTIVYKKPSSGVQYHEPTATYTIDPDGIYMNQRIVDADVVEVDEYGDNLVTSMVGLDEEIVSQSVSEKQEQPVTTIEIQQTIVSETPLERAHRLIEEVKAESGIEQPSKEQVEQEHAAWLAEEAVKDDEHDASN